jgi:hypothetical protein
MFSIGIVQQAGDTGSALATLVSVDVFLGICIELMVFCYCQGYRYPHFYSCLLGDTPPPIFRRLYRSWAHLAVYWALHCYNGISSYQWIQLLRKSCWSESFLCIGSLCLQLTACYDSIGAGLAIVTKQSNMLANTFGFGPQCSFPS